MNFPIIGMVHFAPGRPRFFWRYWICSRTRIVAAIAKRVKSVEVAEAPLREGRDR